ncbi:hypothetical protein V495_01868 [Pseudogymnoascus sp. VKM F-4514 (FW-929)]|nr:hypothetical protein V495_01868 [Pseudogymnoascus sp. VKM F-4514 (FW-929)]KFY62255.1 hypothetical protein V497_02464 [Pseudogymnoascus sp. VKM F-4516 (FW-969)]
MAPDDRTPLLGASSTAQPAQQQRSPAAVRRRFAYIAASSLAIAFVVFVLIPAAVIPHLLDDLVPSHGKFQYAELEDVLLNSPSTDKLSEWSKYYTSGPHLAGTNLSQAVWTQEKWKEFGIEDSTVVPYDVYLNYPLGHRLALLEKPSSGHSQEDEATWKVKFEASLEEDVLEEDPTTGVPNRIPTFHGYSANGNVTARYVYVNYGTYQDFEDLIKANVSLEGNIAIARYGHVFRGLKIKRAQELGMVGAVLYTEPGDDGGPLHDMAENYPDGPGRNPSSVQRGSAQFLSMGPGDPTTPGYPSKPGVPRLPTDANIPQIPSIPISYVDALPILKALNGYGPSAKDLNEHWEANLGLGARGVHYNAGPSPEGLVLKLVNEQDYKITPIWNVIGIINGTLSDEVIVVGNHRDAWIVGGAGDPNSGSAAIMEVIRGFGQALSKGWKPLRTIVFASWDGEEYGLVGSTEWVEEYIPWLSDANVAYVNIDVGCSGPKFVASASPLLNDLILEVTSKVQSPNQTVEGQSVRDVWGGHISTMGSGSDFTAFQDYAGISSIDIAFTADDSSAVYQYHSNYDSYHWMETYGDPGWHYHAAVSKVLGLFVAKLAHAPLVPFRTTDYGKALIGYVQQIDDLLEAVPADSATVRFRPTPDISEATTSHRQFLRHRLKKMQGSAHRFLKVAKVFDEHVDVLRERAAHGYGWLRWCARLKLYLGVRKANFAMKLLDRKFLYAPGLTGRNWFKHVIFAPGLWTGYAGAVFPSLAEAIDGEDKQEALRWIRIIDDRIIQATKSLELN